MKIKWTVLFFIFSITILVIIGSLNFIVDPLWSFKHSNFLNQVQYPFNEREQKTNLLTFNDNLYDTLIIGPSRTTYINQNDFIGYNAFNYAAAGMHPIEFSSYINYAKSKMKSEFKYIIMEIYPMVCTEEEIKNFYKNTKYEPPENFIKRSNEKFYRFRISLSIDTLMYSTINVISSFKPSNIFNFGGTRLYDRNNVAWVIKPSNETIDGFIKDYINIAKKREKKDLNKNQMKYIYQKIVKENPNTTFIVFMPPMPSPSLMADIKYDNGYELIKQTITDAIDVFGHIYFFMTINNISKNYHDNFKDSTHFLPHVGSLMVDKIINGNKSNVPDNFGLYITKDNLRASMDTLYNQFKLSEDTSE